MAYHRPSQMEGRLGRERPPNPAKKNHERPEVSDTTSDPLWFLGTLQASFRPKAKVVNNQGPNKCYVMNPFSVPCAPGLRTLSFRFASGTSLFRRSFSDPPTFKRSNLSDDPWPPTPTFPFQSAVPRQGFSLPPPDLQHATSWHTAASLPDPRTAQTAQSVLSCSGPFWAPHKKG